MNPIQFYEFGKHVFLKFTQQFNNTYWKTVIAIPPNSVAVSANAVTAPDGTLTADRIYNSLGISTACVLYENNLRVQSGKTYSLSIYAKAGASGFLQIFGRDTTFGTSNTYSYANFDLINGLVTQIGAGMTARIQLDNNGWYRCMLSGTPIQKGIGIFGVGIVQNSNSGRLTWTSPGDELYIWGAKVELGATATDYKNEFTQTVYTGASPL